MILNVSRSAVKFFVILFLIIMNGVTVSALDESISPREKLKVLFFLYEDVSIAYENIITRPHEFLDLFTDYATIACDILPKNDFNSMVSPIEYYEIVSTMHDRLFRINSVTIVPLSLHVIQLKNNQKTFSVEVEKFINASSKNDVTYNQISFRHKIEIILEDSVFKITRIQPVGDQGKLLIINHPDREKWQEAGLESFVVNRQDTILIEQRDRTIYRLPSSQTEVLLKPNHHFYFGRKLLSIDRKNFLDNEGRTNHTDLIFQPKVWFFNIGLGGIMGSASNTYLGSTTFSPDETEFFASNSLNRLGLLNVKMGGNFFVSKKSPIFLSVSSGFIFYSRYFNEELSSFQNSSFSTDAHGFDYVRNYFAQDVRSELMFNNILFTHSLKLTWGVHSRFSIFLEPEILYSSSTFQTMEHNIFLDQVRITGLYHDDDVGISYVLGNDDVYNVLDFGLQGTMRENINVDLTELLFVLNYGFSFNISDRSMLEFGVTSILVNHQTTRFSNDSSIEFLNLTNNVKFGFFGGAINFIPRLNYVVYL
ncbi:MAG: hypothetical protein JJU02_01690 [Cryomorphaceae bacterium]|nr:hypothetical protein [Cryomorphaceae bacterium]